VLVDTVIGRMRCNELCVLDKAISAVRCNELCMLVDTVISAGTSIECPKNPFCNIYIVYMSE
jgi:hypothetical protein